MGAMGPGPASTAHRSLQKTFNFYKFENFKSVFSPRAVGSYVLATLCSSLKAVTAQFVSTGPAQRPNGPFSALFPFRNSTGRTKSRTAENFAGPYSGGVCLSEDHN